MTQSKIAPKFVNTDPNFANTLRKRVNAYFSENNKSTHADTKMVLKTIFYLTLWLGSYTLLLTLNLNFITMFLLWCAWGFGFSAACVNIGHDAIHGSYSKKKWVNNLLSHTFNLSGASAYLWSQMHNVAHHTFTNIHEHDEDVTPAPILRLSPDSELKSVHKNQHWYCFLLYPLASLSWIIKKDFIKFFENSVANYNNRVHPKSEVIKLFLYKAISYTLFIIVPFVFIDMPFWQKLISFLCGHFIAGFYIAIIFMLAHAVEEVGFPKESDMGTIENTWFIHQLETTANFSTEGKLAAFISGGLNQQVEHHLFPNICSTHYPDLSHIVRETAKEFNVVYLEHPTFLSAVKSHLRFLKKLGNSASYEAKSTIEADKQVPLVA